MKTACALLVALLASCGSTTSLSLYGGDRSFDDADFGDVDGQSYVGGEFLWGVLPWGLGLEVGVGESSDDATSGGAKLDTSTLELYVGARKTFREDERLRPYIAGGLSFLDTELSLSGSGGGDFDSDDTSEAFYVRAGLGYHFALFHLGVDYRVNTLGEADFDGSDVDLDSGLISFFVGLSF